MKLLLVSDQVHDALYKHFEKKRWQDIDLILSAGDLPANYLSFLVTMIDGVPLYYVRGNHDDDYQQKPPLGCQNLHGKIVTYRGLTIMGLEGSNWYNGQGIQYRERTMKWRVFKLLPRILFRKKIDIIITHAPPYGCYPVDKPAHKGFKIFRYLIDKLQPAYFIHGHFHLSYGRQKRIIEYNRTKVINAYQYYQLEI